MTIFLRTKDNKTLIDAEVWSKTGYTDIRVAMNIENYSQFLLLHQSIALKTEQITSIIRNFQHLSQLRGWLWEVYKMQRSSGENDFPEVFAAIKEQFQIVAELYDLCVVTD